MKPPAIHTMPTFNARSPARWLARLGLGVLLAAAATGLWLAVPSAPVPIAGNPQAQPSAPGDASAVERGRYLATLGNCQGCHTVPGQAAYSGGAAIHTPFGTVYGPNLTPSKAGLGNWSADDFWRALHWGQRPDGQWLSPAFPYTNTTHVRRADSDALFAYLQSLPPDDTPNRASELRWPYNTQAALKAWRALYFRPGDPDTATTATDATTLERGRYLVQGLGHCSACHAPRGRWGGAADALALSGGPLPNGWYAPSLLDPADAGLQGWAIEDAVRLLHEGRHGVHSVQGPMADVVADSLRHWRAEDTLAMALYLQSLPAPPARRPSDATRTASLQSATGARLYDTHCASCHGQDGQGYTLNNGQVAYPPLAGHRAVLLDTPANLLQVVLEGGFGLATPAHPRPFGMPPFRLQLSDAELADLLTHIRTAWGNTGTAVTELDIHRMRQGQR